MIIKSEWKEEEINPHKSKNKSARRIGGISPQCVFTIKMSSERMQKVVAESLHGH